MRSYVAKKRVYFITALLFMEGLGATAQVVAPGRSWKGATEYLLSNRQDSIFVFYSTPSSPSLGTLRATFSDGAASTFKWYKYNSSPSIPPHSRFQLFSAAPLGAQSELTGLSPGGYRVEAVRASDDSTEVYTVWLFVDNVVLFNIIEDSNCMFLYLEAVTIPDRYSIVYELFTYYDLSTTGHIINNKMGVNYLKNIQWQSSHTNINVPTLSSLSITIQNPAPLFNSSYTIRLGNPFGRLLLLTSPEIPAKATRAAYDLFINSSVGSIPSWQPGGGSPKGEALLEIKLESKALNADSVFWNIINDEGLFRRGGDSIIWRHKAGMGGGILEAFPPKELMVPGRFRIEHISQQSTSGCRDTINMIVAVDTSFIKAGAIPNVFSPNGDGQNDFYLIKEPETNLKSIKHFSISIYSRWGKRVYTYTGDPRSWVGWNGKMDGKFGEVPEGVYYYVIEATGWDGRSFKGGVYKGFLHLFRGI